MMESSPTKVLHANRHEHVARYQKRNLRALIADSELRDFSYVIFGDFDLAIECRKRSKSQRGQRCRLLARMHAEHWQTAEACKRGMSTKQPGERQQLWSNFARQPESKLLFTGQQGFYQA